MGRRGYRPIITPDACIVHDVGGASPSRREGLRMLKIIEPSRPVATPDDSGDESPTRRRWRQVFQAKATLLREHFHGWRRRVVLAELVAGVALRAAMTSIGPGRHRPNAEGWHQVWRDRHLWIGGYDERADRYPRQ